MTTHAPSPTRQLRAASHPEDTSEDTSHNPRPRIYRGVLRCLEDTKKKVPELQGQTNSKTPLSQAWERGRG